MEHKQNQIVYLVKSIGNKNNSVDFSDEDPQTFDDRNEALNAAKETTRATGMRTYVYQCLPLLRIDRGKVRVTKR